VKIHPIRTRADYEKAKARLAELFGQDGETQRDEREVLSVLLERWDRTANPLPSPTPLDAIRFRMAQEGLRPRDLEPFLGSRSRVSEILSGSRPLSIDMIRALVRHLHIPAASLIGDIDESERKVAAVPSSAALAKLRTFGALLKGESVQAMIGRAFGSDPAGAMLRKTRTERTNAKTDRAALEAWCAVVMLRAEATKLPRKLTDKPRNSDTARELARLSILPNGPTLVKSYLAGLGIVFVPLEHLPGTYLDGAAMCRSDGAPVIALTLRHDRMDNFWFTLLHEFAHVCLHLNEGQQLIVDDLDVKGDEKIEDEADRFAQVALIDDDIWQRLSAPNLDTDGLQRLAGAAGVHVAIAAGRWQRENNDYRRFSKLLGRGEVKELLVGGSEHTVAD
jgi:HTH-type transcriptional regulator/antitoxin HigA